MKKYLVTFIFLAGFLNLEAQYAASNFTLISVINPETGVNGSGNKYSGCWGWYQQNKNKEYAIACSKSGTYWVDISNPATPTICAYKTGSLSNCTWREVKTYLNYCYVVSDDGGSGSNSFQIFDMQYLPDSVSKVYDNKNLIKRGHALWIDGNRLYVSSVTYSNNTYSSLNVYSLANPTSPTLIRRLNQDYSFITNVHDVYARNDTVYASCAYQGLYVFKLTSSNTFSMLGSLTSYPFSGYNHASALTPNGQTLVFADEVPNSLPFKVANVSNLGNIQVLATANQFPATTPHNPFMVSNQYCFMSSYQEGLQLYDISNPSAPFLAGYFDTYFQGGGNTSNWGSSAYRGNWGAYPYFPSKTIFALDMLNGIFLLKTALYQNPAVAASFTLPPTICPGKTLNIVANSTGATTYSWTFSSGAQASPNSTNSSVSYSATGIYSVTFNASNPSYTTSVTQTIAVVNITAAVTVTNTSCSTSSIGIAKVVAGNGMAPYTYTWLPTGGNASLAVNLAPDCYTANILDANGCAASSSNCVSYNNIGLQSAVTVTNNLCNNSSNGIANVVTTNGSGPFTYTWVPSGGNGPLAVNLTPGCYTVNILDANGCAASSSTCVSYSMVLQSAVTATDPSCSNCANGIANVVSTNGTAPFTYSWMPFGGNASMAVNLTPGCYTVNILDANGCAASSSVCVSFNVGLQIPEEPSISALIYPNPAENLLTVDYPGTFEYSLVNSLGQILKENRNIQNKTIFSVEDLPSGIYFLDIESAKDHVRKKIIIEH